MAQPFATLAMVITEALRARGMNRMCEQVHPATLEPCALGDVHLGLLHQSEDGDVWGCEEAHTFYVTEIQPWPLTHCAICGEAYDQVWAEARDRI